MSSVCVNWTKSDAPPSEVYKGNHQWLERQLSNVVNEIKEKEEHLRITAKIELQLSKKLEKKLNEVMKRHTRRLFDSADYMQQHDVMVKDFNTVALDLKYQIEVIYQAISHENLLERVQKLEEKIKKLPQEAALSEDYNKLISHAAKLHGSDSLANKEKSLEVLEKQLKVYGLLYEQEQVKKSVSETMGVLDIKEEIANITVRTETIKKERLKTKIHTYHEKIKIYDKDRYAFYESKKKLLDDTSLDRLRILLSSIKLEYGELKSKVIWTKIYKDELRLLKHRLGEKNVMNSVLIEQIDQMLDNMNIQKSEFQLLEKKTNEHLKSNTQQIKLAQKLQENLSSLGYSVQNDIQSDIQLKLQKGEVVYMDTDNQEYKIMVKLGQNQDFSIRFVRVVGSQSEKDQVSIYQKQKDTEYAQKWCSDFDKLQTLLKQNQIFVGEKLRMDPEDNEIMYVVDTELIKKRKGEKKVEQHKTLVREMK